MSIFFLAKNVIMDWALFRNCPAAQILRWATLKLDFTNSAFCTDAYPPGGGVQAFTLYTLLIVRTLFIILKMLKGDGIVVKQTFVAFGFHMCNQIEQGLKV